jgi:hypothetical protein
MSEVIASERKYLIMSEVGNNKMADRRSTKNKEYRVQQKVKKQLLS